MKTFLLASLFTFNSFAASFTCMTKEKETFRLDLEKNVVLNLTIGTYEIIRNGKQLPDDQIGKHVFDVKVGKMTSSAGKLKFNVSLQDYSDQEGWEITISKSSHEVAMIQSFRSSDGDDKVHVIPLNLDCR